MKPKPELKELNENQKIAGNACVVVVFFLILIVLFKGCSSVFEGIGDAFDTPTRSQSEIDAENDALHQWQYNNKKDQETYDALKELEYSIEYYENQ